MPKRVLRPRVRPPLRRPLVAATNGVNAATMENRPPLKILPRQPPVYERFVVRSVDIIAFVTIDGIVLYKVAVQATEGRHWTVVRRYSDFKELEQNTWKLRVRHSLCDNIGVS